MDRKLKYLFWPVVALTLFALGMAVYTQLTLPEPETVLPADNPAATEAAEPAPAL